MEPTDFFVDLINILPEGVECYIQAPSLENSAIKEMLRDSEHDYYKVVRLDKKNKEEFIKQEFETAFSGYIQRIEIKQNGALLFEGFDGVEFGQISKNLFIPEWFQKKYVPDTCVISSEW